MKALKTLQPAWVARCTSTQVNTGCRSCRNQPKTLPTTPDQMKACRETRLKAIVKETQREQAVWNMLYRLFKLSLFKKLNEQAQKRLDTLQLLLEIRTDLILKDRRLSTPQLNYHQRFLQAQLLDNLPPCSYQGDFTQE
ncbi:MAG: hypothetical protein SVR94_17580 [Pseudomonadota bacterium]|nr:hypothetical protein [Pseudomonadota bacterium]